MARARTETRTTENAQVAKPQQAVATLAPSRLPINPRIAEEYDLTAARWRVLVEQVFPSAKSVEAVLMALEYCRARNLDIFKRPVHIVPMWSTQKGGYVETVWPGISEIRTTAARTNAYAGMDPMQFGPIIHGEFTGQVKEWVNKVEKWVDKKVLLDYPEYVDVTVWRIVQGIRVPFTVRTWWEEAYASIGKSEIPNEMWQKRPNGQLAKCGEAAALRLAFPEEVGNVYAAEEMEGKSIDVAVTKPQPASAPPTAAPAIENDEPDQAERDKFLDELEAKIEAAGTRDAVHEVWDAAEVERTLSGHEADLTIAFNLRAGRLAQFPKIEDDQPEESENEHSQ